MLCIVVSFDAIVVAAAMPTLRPSSSISTWHFDRDAMLVRKSVSTWELGYVAFIDNSIELYSGGGGTERLERALNASLLRDDDEPDMLARYSQSWKPLRAPKIKVVDSVLSTERCSGGVLDGTAFFYAPWSSTNLFHLHNKTLLPLAAMLLADSLCGAEANPLAGCAAAQPRVLFALDRAPPEMKHTAILHKLFDAVVDNAYEQPGRLAGTLNPLAADGRRYCVRRAVWNGGGMNRYMCALRDGIEAGTGKGKGIKSPLGFLDCSNRKPPVPGAAPQSANFPRSPQWAPAHAADLKSTVHALRRFALHNFPPDGSNIPVVTALHIRRDPDPRSAGGANRHIADPNPLLSALHRALSTTVENAHEGVDLPEGVTGDTVVATCCNFKVATLPSMLALTAGVRVVIGLHGAGLINALYAPQGVVLVELSGLPGYGSDGDGLFEWVAMARRGVLVKAVIHGETHQRGWLKADVSLALARCVAMLVAEPWPRRTAVPEPCDARSFARTPGFARVNISLFTGEQEDENTEKENEHGRIGGTIKAEQKSTSEKLQEIHAAQEQQWTLMDRDRDGIVTQDEVAAIKDMLLERNRSASDTLQQFEISLLKKVSEDHVKFYNRVDKDKDGKLTWEEYRFKEPRAAKPEL